MSNHTWLSKEQGKYLVSEYEVVPHIKPGYYEVIKDRVGLWFKHIEVRTDAIFDVSPDTQRLLREIDRFWNARGRYADLGVAYKRGVMLTGAPGGGKSTIVRQAVQMVAERGGFALLIENTFLVPEAIKELRRREPDAPIVLVLEDIDEATAEDDDGYTDESAMLEVLDGTTHMDNILFVATTNYPEKIAERMLRPGRFDTKIEVPMPSLEMRRKFVAALLKLPVDDSKVERYANDPEVDNKSLAHLKEFVIFREIYADEVGGESGG